MSPIILALVAFALVMLYLALFARGGPQETSRVTGGSDPTGLSGKVRSYLTRQGMVIEDYAALPDGADFVAKDSRPMTGQQLYVRVYDPRHPDAVETGEVQAALDRLKGDGFHKALLISRTGFSDEARAAGGGLPVELIDGAKLDDLLGREAPRDRMAVETQSPTKA